MSIFRLGLASLYSLIILATISLPNAWAQFGGGGFSSASVSTIRSGICPPPENIVVEEFYNFHFHDIPFPKGDEVIHLDARWGTPHTNDSNRYAYLQVGLATTRDIDLKNVRPLNVSFVIDRSGSMQGDRIAKVKKALLASLKKLRKTDRVSIVTFSDDAETIYGPQLMKDPRTLRLAIDGIKADGSTNLCAGLMMGYRQVQRHFDARYNNRVVVLTDGNANVGVTDSEEIALKSIDFNQLGIDLSTIGLGQDFNQSLMRRLARSGRGLIHFVADDEDINKVFVDELDGLLSGVARNISLTIDYSDGLQVDHVYGYSPRLSPRRLAFSIDPLNTGTTQVLLTRFRVSNELRRSAELPILVRLSYQDIASGETRTVERKGTLHFDLTDGRRIDPLSDSSVRRNVTIADIAQGMKRMSQLLEEQKPKTAGQHLQNKLRLAASRYPMALDPEVVRTKALAVGYMDKIKALMK